MNNALFGKTMENIRFHKTAKLLKKWEGQFGAKNLISGPLFLNCTILDDVLLLY